jgi:hypothetical protein
LVTQLQNLPHLEELSIGFAIPIPLPSSEGDLLPAPIPPVTLPTLRRLTFRGVGVYLDNLVAQINTPLLELLNLTLFFELAFALVNLTEFVHRTERLVCLIAQVTFKNDGPFIDAEQRGVGELSLRVICEPLDWQIDSVTQVCSALGEVLSAVEELTIDLDVDGMPSDWKNTLDNTLWHELLSLFIGVKKLHIGSSLTLEFSQALEPDAGELVLELLPELQELEVQLEIGQAENAFSAFLETRESVGRLVHLLAPGLRMPHAYQARHPYSFPESLFPAPPNQLWSGFPEPRNQLSSPFPARAATVWHAGKDEKAPPKKERRTHENKRRLRENPQGRANENWRHRQLSGASRINARISHPGGRKIAI